MYYQGWYESLTGKPQAAIKSWTDGLDAAKKFNVRYEEGLIRLKLGILLENRNEQMEHFQQAVRIFETMGAMPELEKTKTAMAGGIRA